MKRGLKATPGAGAEVERGVTILAPMKRGLKASTKPVKPDRPAKVTILAPMKRGLKEHRTTESSVKSVFVTILAPMKRGLKGHGIPRFSLRNGRYNPCPDEKGTERS